MVFTEAGIFTLFNSGFCAKALDAISESWLEMVTVVSLGLAWKHISPMVFTVLGMVNEVSSSQPRNALFPNDSTTQSGAKVTLAMPLA